MLAYMAKRSVTTGGSAAQENRKQQLPKRLVKFHSADEQISQPVDSRSR
jgi:hypothetical protein